MTAALAPLLILGLLAQAPPPTGDAKEERAARLDLLKQSLAIYEVRPAGAGQPAFRLEGEPVLRFTNPVGGSLDGAIFFWVDADGRPGAAVQAFLRRDGDWIHDFSSLATGPLVADARGNPAWHPRRGGVAMQPVPGAPKPADTPAARLRQMREIADGFAVSDNFRTQGWQALRPLAKPLARYGKPGSDRIDGAIYCYALGTDPEAYLILEARAGADGPGWQFGFAPQTTYPLRASWKGREVWSVENRNPWNPDEPFFGRTYRPGE